MKCLEHRNLQPHKAARTIRSSKLPICRRERGCTLSSHLTHGNAWSMVLESIAFGPRDLLGFIKGEPGTNVLCFCSERDVSWGDQVLIRPWNGPWGGGDFPIRCNATLLVFSPPSVFFLLCTFTWSPGDYSACVWSKQQQRVSNHGSGNSDECVAPILVQALGVLSSDVLHPNNPQESLRSLDSNALTDTSTTRCPSDWCLNALFVILFEIAALNATVMRPATS
ncbi:hypothetical protein BS47DRAFT_341179 [Hydnum rufescens UP504]|uniref:Uncharacterized protein n=1 Tax=Hydnum rufescens UP504 TaxID=1448309 RepID=A0A9P6AJX8_9AGAM|nr:hypothetical protein BS47DRAFT_341179 [Hydnum rufescens UP504]